MSSGVGEPDVVNDRVSHYAASKRDPAPASVSR